MQNEVIKTRSEKSLLIENKTEPIEQKTKNNKLKKILIFLIIIIILFVTYSRYICPKFININENKIESNIIANSFHGLKIIHFSDLHYGTTIDTKQLNKIVEKINKYNPDIIFFTGDLIDKNIIITEENKKDIIDALNNLEPSLYKYAIYGDEDINNEYYNEIMTSSNFKILNNESTLLYYKDNTPIVITGFNTIDSNPNYTILTDYVNEIDISSYYKIVLVHEPDSIDNFINYNPNLVLSGHSLGGLIEIPGFKPLFLNKNSEKYYKEYYKINNTEIYISNGLGTSNINYRFNNTPSFNLYRLYKTN